jgi:hypothetical protein
MCSGNRLSIRDNLHSLELLSPFLASIIDSPSTDVSITSTTGSPSTDVSITCTTDSPATDVSITSTIDSPTDVSITSTVDSLATVLASPVQLTVLLQMLALPVLLQMLASPLGHILTPQEGGILSLVKYRKTSWRVIIVHIVLKGKRPLHFRLINNK